MYWWHPRRDIDAFLGIISDTLSSTKSIEYVRILRQRLYFAYNKAQESRLSKQGLFISIIMIKQLGAMF